MKLADYLATVDLTDAEFGKLVGLSQSQVNRLRHGRSRPSWDILPAIFRASGGKVTAADFADEPQPEAAE